MSWSQPIKGSSAIDLKKHKGEALAGRYAGSRQITTPIGDQVIWEFTDNSGVRFGVFGFTNLNRAMEALGVGAVVQLTYTGTQFVETKFGKRDVHQVEVRLWEGDAALAPKIQVPQWVKAATDDHADGADGRLMTAQEALTACQNVGLNRDKLIGWLSARGHRGWNPTRDSEALRRWLGEQEEQPIGDDSIPVTD